MIRFASILAVAGLLLSTSAGSAAEQPRPASAGPDGDDVILSVLYPNQDGATFDHDYYVRTHMPLVQDRWGPMGLKEARAMRGLPGADGAQPPYQVITLLRFETADHLQKAEEAHGAEIGADIAEFTNVEPILQVNEALD